MGVLLEFGRARNLRVEAPGSASLGREGPGTVAHHPSLLAARIARITQIEARHRPAAPRSSAKCAIQRAESASIIRAKGGVVEPLNCPCRGKVAPLRSCIVEIVREIGAHYEQSTLAKQRLDDQCHLFRRNFVNEQWDNGEILKHALKKWQFDLERVLGRVWGVVDSDEPGISQSLHCTDIDRDISQRRGEGA